MRGNHSRVKEEHEQLREAVKVEEKDNFFPPDCRVLAVNMVDHDGRHDQGSDVNDTGGCRVSLLRAEHARTRLENDRIVNVDVPRIALWDEAEWRAQQRA